MKTFLISLAATAAFTHPATAQDSIGSDRYAMAIKADAHPANPHAARRTLARIERAAVAVCGASAFSLREMQLAIRESACWRTSVAEAVARTDDPLLTAAFRPHR